jgi:two-component system response regulator ArlR
MIRNKIIIVEDDPGISKYLQAALRGHDYEPMLATDGKTALEMIASHCPDLLLLDLGLPDMDGSEIIRSVRSWSRMPIIVISARSAELDKAAALDMGADDYLTKPFSTGELLARIRALTRRKGEVEVDCLHFAELQLNRQTYDLIQGETRMKLSLKEYQIMEMLLSNPEQIIPKERFIEKIWGYESDVEYNNIEVYISFLRKKLTAIHSTVQIRTARGIGYFLEKKV